MPAEPLGSKDPSQVGKYKLLGTLGAGGMGRVYLGISPGRLAAVKVIHEHYAHDEEFLARFRREVAAAKAVNGAYTAPVIESGLDDSPPWFATAYVDGPSLATAVDALGRLPEAALWRLLGGLAEAFRAVHECRLVHRDLKPANILLDLGGPKVIDFGITKALEAVSGTGAARRAAAAGPRTGLGLVRVPGRVIEQCPVAPGRRAAAITCPAPSGNRSRPPARRAPASVGDPMLEGIDYWKAMPSQVEICFAISPAFSNSTTRAGV